jgi:hypothetical protein
MEVEADGFMILFRNYMKCLFLQVVLEKLMKELHVYLLNLHTLMRCLHALTASLPKSPLGKQVCVWHFMTG